MPRKTKKPTNGQIQFETELTPVAELTPHPRNYRSHAEDQLLHLEESLREHGYYRNVVVARDGTILAGHGVVLASRRMGIEEIPVIRLDIEPNDPQALKVLTGDNEIAKLGEVNDRALTEILKEIKEFDATGLLGTGYDEKMLAGLVFVTRPQSEVENFDAAAHWVGMPEYEVPVKPKQMIVSFQNDEARDSFLRKLGVASKCTPQTKSIWWPWKDKEDRSALMFEG